MPPLPSPSLSDVELETLQRWNAAPVKGPPPPDNVPPTVEVSGLAAVADATLAFTAVLNDPNGDSVIGVIRVGAQAFLMNRPGSFSVQIDASAWPAGLVRPSAVLCDGWTNASYDLGPVLISH